MKKMETKNQQKGFTILVAVITAGILLIIAMSIGGIALKEQILSSSNKDSQIAFYAADTGMECAMYLDQKKGIFLSNDKGNSGGLSPGSWYCGQHVIALAPALTTTYNAASIGDHAQYNYYFEVDGIKVGGGSGTTCAIVTIEKDTDPNNPDHVLDKTKIYTKVTSNGYSTCQPSLTRLERGIVANY